MASLSNDPATTSDPALGGRCWQAVHAAVPEGDPGRELAFTHAPDLPGCDARPSRSITLGFASGRTFRFSDSGGHFDFGGITLNSPHRRRGQGRGRLNVAVPGLQLRFRRLRNVEVSEFL
jgi:hypothetical protein